MARRSTLNATGRAATQFASLKSTTFGAVFRQIQKKNLELGQDKNRTLRKTLLQKVLWDQIQPHIQTRKRFDRVSGCTVLTPTEMFPTLSQQNIDTLPQSDGLPASKPCTSPSNFACAAAAGKRRIASCEAPQKRVALGSDDQSTAAAASQQVVAAQFVTTHSRSRRFPSVTTSTTTTSPTPPVSPTTTEFSSSDSTNVLDATTTFPQGYNELSFEYAPKLTHGYSQAILGKFPWLAAAAASAQLLSCGSPTSTWATQSYTPASSATWSHPATTACSQPSIAYRQQHHYNAYPTTSTAMSLSTAPFGYYSFAQSVSSPTMVSAFLTNAAHAQ
eukprot:m.2772 g.2772  ORF g.2772 m.2772 type:complete len:332 (+) comp3300_c0_seq2:424-1419(+)